MALKTQIQVKTNDSSSLQLMLYILTKLHVHYHTFITGIYFQYEFHEIPFIAY